MSASKAPDIRGGRSRISLRSCGLQTGGNSMTSAATAVPSSQTEHLPFHSIAPPLLCFASGYVDSCSYIGLLGLFTAQVTGSFVVAGAQIVLHEQAGLGKLLAP